MPKYEKDNADFSFEIVKHLGIVGHYNTGWQKEINMVSWRGGTPKLDIRDWDENHERMSRGVTLHRNEVTAVMKILLKYYGSDLKKDSDKAASEDEPVDEALL